MTGAGTTVDEARYLPFLEGPRSLDQASFRWRLGVRELDLRDWIELGPDADAAIAAKPRLNAEHRSTVFAALDGVEREAQQVARRCAPPRRRRPPPLRSMCRSRVRRQVPSSMSRIVRIDR